MTSQRETSGQPPEPDCRFCDGSGEVTEARAAEINTRNGVRHALVRSGRCLCTVSWGEVAEELPAMFQRVIANA